MSYALRVLGLRELTEDLRSAREALERLLNEARHTRLWQARAHLQGVERAAMSRFEHGVIGIETLVATLGWDHATLMVVSRMQWEMLPPETKTAIQHRVMVAADWTLWVQDYLVWAAWWEHDGRGEADTETRH